jgi:hypothetical protein
MARLYRAIQREASPAIAAEQAISRDWRWEGLLLSFLNARAAAAV